MRTLKELSQNRKTVRSLGIADIPGGQGYSGAYLPTGLWSDLFYRLLKQNYGSRVWATLDVVCLLLTLNNKQ